jgi:TonB family protein
MDTPPLRNIRVAAPCNAEWKWMYGNDRVRFCGQCSLNVYNLSAMTTEEAEDLIRRSEERLCVRFYRRRDGTILTENCPVGLEAIKARFTRTRTHIVAAIFALLSYLGLLGAYKSAGHQLKTMNDAVLTVLDEPTTGVMVLPPTVSETAIRERAMFKVIPIYHSTGSSPSRDEVVVTVYIDEKGAVDYAWCETGDPQLDELAKEAARRWRFEPILDRGQPARVKSTLTFNFKD